MGKEGLGSKLVFYLHSPLIDVTNSARNFRNGLLMQNIISTCFPVHSIPLQIQHVCGLT